MGLFDVFKKKKPSFAKATEGKEKKKEKRKEKKAERKTEKVKKEIIQEKELEEIVAPQKMKKIKKRDFSQAYRILKEPHVTEKATNLGKENKYIFKVIAGANKIEVKKAVQDFYGVGVLDVNIINIHRKTKRTAGRKRGGGHKAGYKKAIVTLYPGEKIELMPK